MNFQDGHRQRLKERFRKEGLENMEERYALELLLFYCVPRKDTKELAVRLLEHFGSFVRVMEATEEELQRVPGVGEGISTFLRLCREADRYYRVRRDQVSEPLTTTEKYGRRLHAVFENRRNEMVYVLCLDGKCKELACMLVGEGSVNSAQISVRRIVEICLATNATSVVLAHNHPSGLALPSSDDIQTTARLAQAMQAVDITLIDHLVFTDGDYVSLAQSGYYKMPGL